MTSLDVLQDIPQGIYCYDRENGRRMPCPYWRKFANGAACELLHVVSEEQSVDCLVWDMVKECGINE